MQSFDKYPYTNFHELNLDYFIKEFKRIFDQWDTLYATMTSWKDATDADLAAWKASTLADMTARETALLASLDAWKAETGADISSWESGVLSDLADWKDTFTTYAASITTDAEAARDAAAASATAASGSATAAAGSATAAARSATEAAASAATFETDTTLSVAGKAADAKATGDAVREADGRIDGLETGDYAPIPFTLGTVGKAIDWSTGEERDAQTGGNPWGVPTDYVDISNYAKIKFNRTSTTNASLASGTAFYDENKQFIVGTQGKVNADATGYESGFTVYPPATAKYARFTTYYSTTTYGEFELHGLAKSAQIDVDDKLVSDTDRNLIDDFHRLIDYGYGSDALIFPETSATETRVGIKRQKTLIELNTIIQCDGARFKLNGTVVRTGFGGSAANAIVDAWEGITLTQYHKYRVKATYISGTVSQASYAAISVYEQGSHGTIGVATSGDNHEYSREFVYGTTPVNIVLVAPNPSEFKDFKVMVTLEDITAQFVEKAHVWNAAYSSIEEAVDYLPMAAFAILPTASSGTAAQIGVEQAGNIIRLNGTNDIGSTINVKLCAGPIRASTTSAVDAWTGVDLIVGHHYRIVSTLIEGSVTYPAGRQYTNGIPVSVYRNGEHDSIGNYHVNAGKQFIREFVPDQTNNTLAVLIEDGTTFDNATFSVVIVDEDALKNDWKFLDTANTRRLFARDDGVRDIAQCCAVVDGCLYIYHYLYDAEANPPDSGHGIRKIDFAAGTDTQYDMNLGHGNGMAYYNGKLYVCNMATSGVDKGKIHVIDLSTMTEGDPIIFKIDGTATYNSGIAYDKKNDQFIIKTDTGFAFADTDFVYDHAVTRSQSVPGTGQSISCDGEYIYEIKSGPNCIYVFKHDGTYMGKINIPNEDEAEGMCNCWDGTFYLITHVPDLAYYVDAIQIFKEISFEQIVSLGQMFGKVPY